VGRAIGELEVVKELFHRHQLLPVEEICQFCQADKWNDKTENCYCRNGKVVLARWHDPPQNFKHVFKDLLCLAEVCS
jgi:hypothetical protein